jgi:hypothetical protein
VAPQLDFYMNLLKYSSKRNSLISCMKFKMIHKIFLQEMVFFIYNKVRKMFSPQIDGKVGVFHRGYLSLHYTLPQYKREILIQLAIQSLQPT